MITIINFFMCNSKQTWENNSSTPASPFTVAANLQYYMQICIAQAWLFYTVLEPISMCSLDTAASPLVSKTILNTDVLHQLVFYCWYRQVFPV